MSDRIRLGLMIAALALLLWYVAEKLEIMP
jgi:hypothetical protein